MRERRADLLGVVVAALGVVLLFLGGCGVSGMAERDEPETTEVESADGDADARPRANLGNGEPYDHWHAAFAIEVCGEELPPVQDGAVDPLGIHTHGDGLVHIHPFSREASGENATLSKFFEQVNLEVTDDELRLPSNLALPDGGSELIEGEATCNGQDGELVVSYWSNAASASSEPPDEIYTDDLGSIRFTEDLAAYTLAFVPSGSTDIAAPSSAAEIVELGCIDSGACSPDSGN